MRKFKKFTAAMLAAALMVQGTVLFPVANAESAEEVKYDGVIGYVGTNVEEEDNAWLVASIPSTAIKNGAQSDTKISFNATEFKKVLEIEDGTNIPAARFDFNLVSGNEVDATYDGTELKTFQVKEGLNPENVIFRLENVDLDEHEFVREKTDGYADITDLDEESGVNGFVLEYEPQAIVLPNEGNVLAVKDDVLIYNVAEAEGTYSSVNTYYAIKTVQMDFTQCDFREPGIYRYVLGEVDSTDPSIINDVLNEDDEDFGYRTIDVYVEDATYVDTNDVKQYVLRIAGYVMYNGLVEEGPSADPTIDDDPEEDLMEDGLDHTNPSGNGGANGAEVADAVKSEGIRNLYLSNDLTFKKTVSGNQASNDQFFRFTLTLGDTVPDNAIFAISNDSTQVVKEDWKTSTGNPNSATAYDKQTIYTANAATPLYDEDDENIFYYRYVTGSDLKAGYDFYLQADQYITILGLPDGVSYTLLEYNEDYKPTVELVDEEGYDTMDGDEDSTDDIELIIATEDNATMASISDSNMVGDVYATFNNEKKGTIPTGIIMHVLPVAALAVVFGSGVIIFAARRRNDDEE